MRKRPFAAQLFFFPQNFIEFQKTIKYRRPKKKIGKRKADREKAKMGGANKKRKKL